MERTDRPRHSPCLALLLLLIPLLVAGALAGVAGCDGERHEMLFHAGVGQRSSLLDVQRVFEARHPQARVNFSFKGSGYFIADLERSNEGDLFLPGEEFYLLQAVERGHVTTYDRQADVAAHFMVVIATPRGNPGQVTTIADFARPGVRVGLGNPKACAIGIWDEKIFRRAGIWDQVQRNAVQSAKCIAEKLTSVQNRVVDATLLWSATAVLALRDIEVVPLEPRYRGFVRLPVAVLRHTRHPALAEQLKSFILSAEGRDIFRSHAYVVDPGPLDDEGFCTDGGAASDRDCRWLVTATRAVADPTMPLDDGTVGPLVGEVVRQRKTLRPGAL